MKENNETWKDMEFLRADGFECEFPNKKEMTDDVFKEKLGEIASKLNM
jgi:hypothetical protein